MYGAEVSSAADTLQPKLQIWHPTNATASPNVHEYYPKTTLQFQQGDILGVYYGTNIRIYGQRWSGPLNFYTIVSTNTLTIPDLMMPMTSLWY